MKTKNISIYGLLISLAMILSYVETLIPVFVAVPGVKMGLANIVVVFALYGMGYKSAAVLSFTRIVLVAFTFGNMFSLLYSFAGAVLSLSVMIILKNTHKFGVSAVSVAGACAHNVGQIIIAMFVLETAKLAYYLPVLILSGIASGIVIGLIAGMVAKRVKL